MLPYYYNVKWGGLGGGQRRLEWIGWYSEVKGSKDIRAVMQASIKEIQDFINESQDYV